MREVINPPGVTDAPKYGWSHAVKASGPLLFVSGQVSYDDHGNIVGRNDMKRRVSNPTIAGWHGLEYDAPLRRIEEYIDIFRKVIRQEKLQYQGKKYSSKGFRLPFTPIRKDIPVYIAALRPRMTALAGKLSDGVMVTLGTPDHVREQVRGSLLSDN